MFCPNCGNYTDTNFCPNCGYDMRTIALPGKSRSSAPRNPEMRIYLGNAKITQRQFEELQQLVKTGAKSEAIQRIRMWTSLSVADALHIVDHFYTIDFRKPQALVPIAPTHSSFPEKKEVVRQAKAQKAVKKVGKGVGLAAFFGGYGILHLVSEIVKPYMGKRK